MTQAAFACAFFCAVIWLGLYLSGKRVLNRIWRETWGLGAGLFAALGLIFSLAGW